MSKIRDPIVALDFDGTLVTHQWPDIGRDVGAIYHLSKIKQEFPDVRYILWTVRSGDKLDQAVFYCEHVGINLWGVNENPTQNSWSKSPKAHADVYIDDAAIGIPLIFADDCKRPYIDWEFMGPNLLAWLRWYYANDPRAQE